MSGDVQPRKRKDKKKKRDAFDRKSEDEISFSRQQSVQDDDESSHGVHITKMAAEDVHLHVQHEHGTGGHWCAKLFFFVLMAVLLGLVGLIILENRGLSDLDTPLSESRFSNYFDGWVDESRDDHDHDPHDAVQSSIEEHDEHDEPFEEVEDHSELDDDEHDEEHDDDDEDEDHEDENQDDDHDDDEVDEQTTKEQSTVEDDDDNDDNDEDGDGDGGGDEDDDEDENVTKQSVVDDEDDDDDGVGSAPQTVEDNTAEDDNNDEDDNDGDDDDEKTVEAASPENDDANDDDDKDNNNDDDDDDDDDDVEETIVPIYARSTQQSASHQQSKSKNEDDEDDDAFDEEDDDGTFESLEQVVDNDAEELQLLQEKARQQAAEAAKNAPPSAEDDDNDDAAPSWASSLAVKIGVGVALALVARLVLIRKNPNTIDETPPEAEAIMKRRVRRLTIANADDHLDDDDEDEDYDAPPELEDDEYSDEEIIIEEEIEYVEDDDDHEEHEAQDNIKAAPGDTEVISKMKGYASYVPETFEELNAMYRSTDYEGEHVGELNMSQAKSTAKPTAQETRKVAAVFNAPPPPPLVEADIQNTPVTSATRHLATKEFDAPSPSSSLHAKLGKPAADAIEVTTREVTHDQDYRRAAEDIDYNEADDVEDDDEHYDGEEILEEEEEYEIEEEDEISDTDVDDTDLMKRLEAKYGSLPASARDEYESDEDPDDPTWTQIKPKQNLAGGGRGKLANDDDDDDDEDDDDDDDFDMYEEELRRANEEMMRENYSAALSSFSLLSQKYPDKPRVFLGKATSLDRLSERQRSNKLLIDALEAYKRYLAFGLAVKDHVEYRAAAGRCIERMRFMGYSMQAVPIHELLIERFHAEPEPSNQLAVTLLMLNRLADAKTLLQQILRRWPTDGFAQVHYGFVLAQHDKDYENAVLYLKRGINTQAAGTQDGRFFFNLGDALQRLRREDEALEVYKSGAALKLFPSMYQRSLYNEPRLRAQPFWTKEQTTYGDFLNKLEQNWLAIRDEGLGVLSKRGYFLDETENLRDQGDWKQFELYARGRRRSQGCQKAPITCSLIEQFRAASGCSRGQVKFSVMHPGTHVWAHCGPTNCRLRAHLGLVVPPGTLLRVADQAPRSWTEGQFLIFDDSFEHEVWHNGSSVRLVLIVDFWHPDLSEPQRQSLSPI